MNPRYEKLKAWRKANPDAVKRHRNKRNYEFVKSWRQRNPEKRRESDKRYRQTHKDKYKLRKVLLRSTGRVFPRWANKTKIMEIYNEASRISKLTGVAHHVDHVIPLNHPKVSGLH